MANKDLKRAPQRITDEAWYYEEAKGLTIMHEIRVDGVLSRTDQFLIPWAKIRAGLKRKDSK